MNSTLRQTGGTYLGSAAGAARPVAVRPASLSVSVIGGAIWTTLSALSGKVATFAGQIVLAWLLFPEDFGLAALAASILAFASFFSAGSLQNVLIQQQHRFAELAGPVFWLALALHLFAGLCVAAAAPLAATVLQEPRLVPLILLAAVGSPLCGAAYTYTAKLSADLRFRTLALIQMGEGVLQYAGAVVLAWLGWGPYAILVPQLAVRLYALVAVRLAAGPVPLWPAALWMWPGLLRESGWLMLFALAAGLQLNGIVFVIGLFHGPETTGLFAWGYQVSAQAVFLLILNLRQVLFPTLSRLSGEPERLRAVFRRGTRLLTFVALPVCGLQALLSGMLIPAVFGERWLSAVPVVVWISLGLLTAPLNLVASSLLLGTARNASLALLTAAQTLLLIAAAGVGAALGDHVTAACWVAGAMLVANALPYVVASRYLKESQEHGHRDA